MWLTCHVLPQHLPIGPQVGYNGLIPTYRPPHLPCGQPRHIAVLYEVGNIRALKAVETMIARTR